MRNKILWSDDTKIEHFGLTAKCYVWKKPGTIPTVKHAAGTGRLVRIEGKMNGAKYREIQDNAAVVLGQVPECPLSGPAGAQT